MQIVLLKNAVEIMSYFVMTNLKIRLLYLKLLYTKLNRYNFYKLNKNYESSL